MRRTAPWIAAACLGLGWALALTATGTGTPAANKAAPASIATINLDVLFNRLDEARHLADALEVKRQELVKEPKQLADQMAKINENLELMERSPEEELGDRVRLMVLNEQQKAVVKAAELVLSLENGRMYRELYQKALTTVEGIAAREGYDLVLLDDRAIKVSEGDAERVTASILARQILYATESIDITQAVIDQMNNDYAVGR